MDYLIVVTAPEEVRIQRVTSRDHVSKEAVLDRMSKQLSQDKKLEHADFVINNDGQHALVPQIWKIHKLLLNQSID